MISKKKALPTGVSSFQRLRRGDYYTVDKTMMIQEFLERKTAVTLITRPRRFGKTINMSMVAEFLDITKDSKALFEGLAIMDSEYASYMNTKSVLFITFRSVKGGTKAEFLTNYLNILKDIYTQYDYVFADNSPIKDILRRDLLKIYTTLEQSEDVTAKMQRIACQAIPKLLEAMRAFYGEGVYLFIDEYDTPFIESFIHKYDSDVKALIVSNITNSLKRVMGTKISNYISF